MRRLFLATVAFLLPIVLWPDRAAEGEQEGQPSSSLLDKPLKDFKLRDLMKDAETWISLSDFKEKKAVVLIFTSYNCDACADYENRMLKLIQDFAGQEVAFLGVRSSAEDDAAGMRKYAESKGFTIPFLEDTKNVLAAYLDVLVTPTFYVIDKQGVLRYRGACDESLKEARAHKTFVHDALKAVLEGKEVAVKTTRTIGCHMPRVDPGK
ncbi:MAG TPA: redoxin domain-containing protein [Planctomycetota bacterium]|nr:redoxin domain-containing protein [Planctomycetota bacterium]